MRKQGRFKHLLMPENEKMLEEIEEHVARDWSDLVRRCDSDALAA